MNKTLKNLEALKINKVHQKFQDYGANAKQWRQKCIMLLPEIDRLKVWKRKRFNSLYEYAAKLAGLSRDSVSEALRVLNKLNDKPKLLKVAEEKGLQRIRPIAAIVTSENENFWAEKAKSMSKHVLETYVRDYRLQFLPGEATQSEKQKIEQQMKTLTISIPAQLAIKIGKIKGQDDWATLFQKFVELYEKNLEEELKAQKPATKEKTSRHIPDSIKHYVLKRSNGKCEFPNCRKDYQHLHHTDRFASKREHDPDKIVALCEAHHNLAHKGLIGHEEQLPNKWQIRRNIDYANLNRFIDEQVQFYQRK